MYCRLHRVKGTAQNPKLFFASVGTLSCRRRLENGALEGRAGAVVVLKYGERRSAGFEIRANSLALARRGAPKFQILPRRVRNIKIFGAARRCAHRRAFNTRDLYSKCTYKANRTYQASKKNVYAVKLLISDHTHHLIKIRENILARRGAFKNFDGAGGQGELNRIEASSRGKAIISGISGHFLGLTLKQILQSPQVS